METSQAPAIESFSYSWLTNKRFSLDSLSDASDEATFEENMRSKRFLEEVQNFNFHVPLSESLAALIPADEIFSDGHILPKYGHRSNKEAPDNTSNSSLSMPVSSLRTVSLADKVRCDFLKKWQKSSKRILRYLGFLRPLYRKAGCSRSRIRVDDIDRKVREVQSWHSSPLASSPRQSPSSVGNCRDIRRSSIRAADTDRGMRKVKSWSNSPQASLPRSPSYCSTSDWSIDSSIYEAILHCKRSFENRRIYLTRGREGWTEEEMTRELLETQGPISR